MLDELNLLIITDVHYVDQAKHTCPHESRKASLGLELVQRGLRWALRTIDVDAIALLGDLLDNGKAEDAELDLIALRDAINSFGKPIMLVPGNHDTPPEHMAAILGDEPGAREIKGYQLITFADRYDENDVTTRGAAGLQLVRSARAEHPDAPLIVLQHNPIHPPIESSYPYHLTDNDEVMRTYSECRVTLSVSAHYHPGQELHEERGVQYVTAPALAEVPFRMLHLRLRGTQVEANEIPLALDAPFPLVDVHMHSHYAYCDAGMQPAQAIERAKLMGLDGMVFAEHAAHLYVSAKEYGSGALQDDLSMMQQAKAAGTARMDAYRREMEPLRSDFVGLALEVDFDRDGNWTLLDEDREGWDFFIAAVHRIAGFDPQSATPAELRREFMAANERALSSGAQVLAHPFRYFRRSKIDTPKDLYRPLARMIAQSGVAAEINFHTNEPDPEFFGYLLEEGATLALGTDAHSLVEVAEMQPHLELLREIGWSDDRGRRLFTGR